MLRAGALARAGAGFADLLGAMTQGDLLEYVRSELGHEEILDAFVPRAGHLTRAIAPRIILHVISGNTPHAGLQSLVRGLLLGSHNRCKLPKGGLADVKAFVEALPRELAGLVEISETLPETWLEEAEAVVVFGSDTTIAEFRRRIRPGQCFVAHGHRVSLALVLEDDPAGACAAHAARAASLFDQQGCLSPHLFYVREPPGARAYAASLAAEMARYAASNPPAAPPSPAEAADIQALREDWRFRVANDPQHFGLWQSEHSTAWTVLYDGADLNFAASPLHRTVFVKPLPDDLRAALANVREHVSAIGIWPASREAGEWLATLDTGASRICPIEHMQAPPLAWRQDGACTLAGLVRWMDLECDA